jgi:hypothetical protein
LQGNTKSNKLANLIGLLSKLCHRHIMPVEKIHPEDLPAVGTQRQLKTFRTYRTKIYFSHIFYRYFAPLGHKN